MSSVNIITPVPTVIEVVVTPPTSEGAPVNVEVLNAEPTIINVEVMAPGAGDVTQEDLDEAMDQAVQEAVFYAQGLVSQRMYLNTWETTSSINVLPGAFSFDMVAVDDTGNGKKAQYVIQDGELIRLLNESDKEDLIPVAEKGQANGVMPLDSGGKAYIENLPDSVLGNLKFAGTYNGIIIAANDNFPELNGQSLPTSGYVGIYLIVTADYGAYKVGDWTVHQGSGEYVKVDNSDAVTTVFGRMGNVVANESDYEVFYPKLGIVYLNPSWIGELSYNKISGTPTTVSGLGLSDGISSVGDRSLDGMTTLGSDTIAPTHTLTFPSISTGQTFYNTPNQSTDYERVRQYWNGNVFTITTEQAGTGVPRTMMISAVGRNLTIGTGSVATGMFNFAANNSGQNSSWIGISGTFQANGGMQSGISIINTAGQTATAGYRAIWVSIRESTTGSGRKLLIDLGTNSAANGTGTHTSRFSVSSTGVITATGAPTYANDAAADADSALLSGSFYKLTGSRVIYQKP